MRKLFLIVALLLPFSAMAEEPDVHHWVCSQPGYLGKFKAYAITHVFEDAPNDYDAKEEVFEERVQDKTEGEFEPGMDPSCRDFSTEAKADKYLKKMTGKAEQRDYSILWIDFGGLEK